MNIPERLTEALAVVGVIDPLVIADTEKYSDYVDMSKFEQVIAVMATGNVNDKTVDFRCYEAQDGSGTGEQLLTGKAMTQWAAHATTNDNDQAVIGVRRQDLTKQTASAAEFTHVRFGIVCGAAQDGPIAGIVLGGNCEYAAAPSDIATVREII